MQLCNLPEKIDLCLPEATIAYYPNFYNSKEANIYFNELLLHTKWQQDNITLFGKTFKQPRLTAFYANNKKSYSYSTITMKPLQMTETLKEIKNKVEYKTNEIFSSCLINLYRDGNDSNGWHSDNEKELGLNPVIASISLGTERIFKLKHKTRLGTKHKMNLEHGSLLLMKGETQHFWYHQIPKTTKEIGKRINLTFRQIK